jgi:hypothetical protein
MATAGPVALAGATTAPISTPAGAYQAGAAAMIGGWNAGADAAIGGWNAGASALGMPFQFSSHTWGPFGLHAAGVAPLGK